MSTQTTEFKDGVRASIKHLEDWAADYEQSAGHVFVPSDPRHYAHATGKQKQKELNGQAILLRNHIRMLREMIE